METDIKLNGSYRKLRLYLGIVGFSMPIALFFRAGSKWLEAISSYYWTEASPIFTGTLIAFGLLLISYRGHEKTEESKQFLSDNAWTNIAGIFALATAFIPTNCGDIYHPFCPAVDWIGTVHLVCAGAFIAATGAMAHFNFVLSPNRKFNGLYRSCAWIIWISIVAIGVYKLVLKNGLIGWDYGTLVGEIIALYAFSLAWTVKSVAYKYLDGNSVDKEDN